MIRFVLGLFIVLGAVGAEDYAYETGSALPPMAQTLFLVVVGLAIAASGVRRLRELYPD